MRYLLILVSYILAHLRLNPFLIYISFLLFTLNKNSFFILFNISLFRMIKTDFKSYDIYNIDILIFFITSLFMFDYKININNLLFCLMFYITYKLNYLGIGDVILFIIIANILSFIDFLILIYLSSSMALIYYLILHKKYIPYGPFILYSFLLLYLYRL